MGKSRGLVGLKRVELLSDFYKKSVLTVERQAQLQDYIKFSWIYNIIINYYPYTGVTQVVNLKETGSIKDEKGRIWKIVKGLPWTGSKMNISNDYFVNSKDGKDIVVGIAKPDYSKYRINLEFNKKLLSTFDF